MNFFCCWGGVQSTLRIGACSRWRSSPDSAFVLLRVDSSWWSRVWAESPSVLLVDFSECLLSSCFVESACVSSMDLGGFPCRSFLAVRFALELDLALLRGWSVPDFPPDFFPESASLVISFGFLRLRCFFSGSGSTSTTEAKESSPLSAGTCADFQWSLALVKVEDAPTGMGCALLPLRIGFRVGTRDMRLLGEGSSGDGTFSSVTPDRVVARGADREWMGEGIVHVGKSRERKAPLGLLTSSAMVTLRDKSPMAGLLPRSHGGWRSRSWPRITNRAPAPSSTS